MLVPVDRPKLWLLLGALAFMGLFAMHGLNGHGITHAGDAQHHHAAAGHADHAAAGHLAAVADADPCDGTCAASESGATMPSPMSLGHDLAMALCLAVLALAGVLAGLGSNRLALSAIGPAALLPRVTVARAWRNHDPPSVFQLSVRRC